MQSLINTLTELVQEGFRQKLQAFIKWLDIRVVQWELGFDCLSNRRLYCLREVLSLKEHVQVRVFPMSSRILNKKYMVLSSPARVCDHSVPY